MSKQIACSCYEKGKKNSILLRQSPDLSPGPVYALLSLHSLHQFLKEILNELCMYNKRGTNRGTYELKPEYKKTVEDTGEHIQQEKV